MGCSPWISRRPSWGLKYDHHGDETHGNIPSSAGCVVAPCGANIAGWWFGTHVLFSIFYMGCHPSHWLSYFSRWLKPPTSSCLWCSLLIWAEFPFHVALRRSKCSWLRCGCHSAQRQRLFPILRLWTKGANQMVHHGALAKPWDNSFAWLVGAWICFNRFMDSWKLDHGLD